MIRDFIDPSTVTLTEFIEREEDRNPQATGRFTEMLLNIALGTKIASRVVNRAGLAALLGLTGEVNTHGESIQKLDEYCDQLFEGILGRSGEIVSMVSEEREHLFASANRGVDSRYVIAFDPIDGSSNIDVNVAIGTIWGIYRRRSVGAEVSSNDVTDFLQPGSAQVAAGYAIYGSSTMFVFTTGNGVNGFTLDPTIGEFVLTHPLMQIPREGEIYSCNEGNFARWSLGVKAYVDYLKQSGERKDGRRYTARYVGSLVADFHRTLIKGGIFMYPADGKNRNGKLRLLYECAPMALIAEQAGGRASNGRGPILRVTPDTIHARTPFFIGSAEMVEQLESYVGDLG